MTDEANYYKELDSLLPMERVKAIVRLALPMVSTIAGYLGFAFDVEVAWSLACAIIGSVSTIAAWWYNNNMTKAAVAGSDLTRTIKDHTKKGA